MREKFMKTCNSNLLCLIYEDSVLTKSLVITRYICNKYAPELLRTNLQEKAEIY